MGLPAAGWLGRRVWGGRGTGAWQKRAGHWCSPVCGDEERQEGRETGENGGQTRETIAHRPWVVCRPFKNCSWLEVLLALFPGNEAIGTHTLCNKHAGSYVSSITMVASVQSERKETTL